MWHRRTHDGQRFARVECTRCGASGPRALFAADDLTGDIAERAAASQWAARAPFSEAADEIIRLARACIDIGPAARGCAACHEPRCATRHDLAEA